MDCGGLINPILNLSTAGEEAPHILDTILKYWIFEKQKGHHDHILSYECQKVHGLELIRKQVESD